MNKHLMSALAVAGLATFGASVDASADSYTVKGGDTLSSIAAAHGTTVSALASANNMSQDGMIYQGEDIQVNGEAIASAPVDATTYTVKSGDTLAKIAQSHNTTVDKLAALNNLANPEMIYVGEVLQLQGEVQVQATAPVQQAPVEQAAPVQQQATAPVQQQAAPVQQAAAPKATSTASASGSTYDQFIANGGTAAMWNTIVMPESEGNPNAVSPNGYRGLGQTKEGWGTGSVQQQTKGMVNYANSRYGSVSNAVSFRQANGWW
ncbi:LysM peptidoglycan-binding domain-containing protein [Weissella minor]|uniref:LysM peptidoglycan-binding domain-containing protein n=1 Tax=Weissella minor TaxID=1620 RepID=UPI001BB002E6|nr:LysM domain-containing protein [Weissella minor]MBS0949897.1 LysM peptidoglycan-binding domain-containing protein [Weissella minor]